MFLLWIPTQDRCQHTDQSLELIFSREEELLRLFFLVHTTYNIAHTHKTSNIGTRHRHLNCHLN